LREAAQLGFGGKSLVFRTRVKRRCRSLHSWWCWWNRTRPFGCSSNLWSTLHCMCEHDSLYQHSQVHHCYLQLRIPSSVCVVDLLTPMEMRSNENDFFQISHLWE
jgi:hypothetical protein